MTDAYERWLERQSQDYQRGYEAYWAGLTDDISETLEWHTGYDLAQQEDNEARQYL